MNNSYSLYQRHIALLEAMAEEADDSVEIAAVKSVVDDIKVDTDEIDDVATSGLAGISNSLAYRVHEIERHLHGRERWFGKLAVQTATDWADNNIVTPYRCISGNNAYGTDANDEALLVGTADTPAIAGMAKFDLHRVFIVASSSETVWKLQLIYGTGTMADAIAAGQFSTFMLKVDAAAASSPALPMDVMLPRGTCGATKVWMRGWNITNNATIDFFIGWHEYEG
jgi:hypothetical protein